jgi:hypothetical protein
MMILLVIVLAAVAGVAPLFPKHVTRPGEAIAYGIGAQATLKGIVAGVQDAVRP